MIPGIDCLLEYEQTAAPAKKYRDFYAKKPDAPIIMREFGYYSLDRWINEGHINKREDLNKLCGFDEDGSFSVGHLGWCEAEFDPYFEEETLEDRGEYELVRDFAGRHVLYFKGRRNGFMPEYVSSPVKDFESWETLCKWRMQKDTPSRLQAVDETLVRAVEYAKKGYHITQRVAGAYMYLRSLIGPEELLYMFYDNPELIHDCMKTWFELADFIIARVQKQVTIDEIFFGEDICYNHGCLISGDMMKEFLLPYYQQLINNLKTRQRDKNRHLYVQIDTDGYAPAVIPIYMSSIGMDVMSPFEVASNCDVVELSRQYPDLIMTGGIDKRVLSTTTDEIDRMIDRILPVMKKRGGYIPTCDHGVPEEVSFENYMHFRKRLLEYS